jgi:enediyne biosynthesis protein E4
VTLEAGGRTLTGEVQSGSSYASQSDFRLHFGLGTADRTGRIDVRWPNGEREELPGVDANQWITVKEGAGIVDQRPFRRPAGSEPLSSR